MVPPDSHGISRAPCYLGSHPGAAKISSTGVTPSAPALSRPSTISTVFDSLSIRQNQLDGPTTPNTQRLPAITRARFSLFRFRSPLLAESRLLSLPVGTEMFHFPTFPPLALCVQARVTGHDSSRVSPFGNPRITARLTAPRGLSQPPTSFIGSWCQGIHRAPLLTWPQRCSRPLCSSQGTGRSQSWFTVGCDRRSDTAGTGPNRTGPTRGPASVRGEGVNTRSLRTQQRAWALSSSFVFHSAEAVVLGTNF